MYKYTESIITKHLSCVYNIYYSKYIFSIETYPTTYHTLSPLLMGKSKRQSS
jgi:hypothetical protein